MDHSSSLIANLHSPPINEHVTRDGWSHVTLKIREMQRASRPIKVAFLGGSVTRRPNCWRSQIMDLFRSTFPDVQWTEQNAAIGGTNSTFGAFRLDRHVLHREPDLLFVEFALNVPSLLPSVAFPPLSSVWVASMSCLVLFL